MPSKIPKFAECRKQESLSWYKACLRVAWDNNDIKEEGAGKKKRSLLGIKAYELFRDTQHLQPDMDRICEYINTKFEREVTSEIALYRPEPSEKMGS